MQIYFNEINYIQAKDRMKWKQALFVVNFLLICCLSQKQHYYVLQISEIDPTLLSGISIYSEQKVKDLINTNFKGFLEKGLLIFSSDSSMLDQMSTEVNIATENQSPVRSQNNLINEVQEQSSPQPETQGASQPQAQAEVKNQNLIDEVLGDPGLDAPIQLQRQFLLQQLNKLRNQVRPKASELIIDNRLNRVAQLHSEDMARNNYYGHVNLAGLSADDRLRVAGIVTSNAENIARSRSLSSAHNNLAASAKPYRNAVNRDYGRVGFGIDFNADGELVLTIVFAARDIVAFPLTSSQYFSLQRQLVGLVKSKNNNLPQNKRLSADIRRWQKSSRNQPLLSFIKQSNHQGGFTPNVFIATYTPDVINSFRSSEAYRSNANPRFFGANIYEQNGRLELIVVFQF